MKDTKTKQPSLRGINKIVRSLERVIPQARNVERSFEDSVNMLTGHVNSKSVCDTPMCHAGWFAFSVNMDHPKKRCPNYRSGANLMAKELGFKTARQLMDWAHDNPKLWGTSDGYSMFSSMSAFEHTSKNGHTQYRLSTIVRHWKRVADRIRKAKAKK